MSSKAKSYRIVAAFWNIRACSSLPTAANRSLPRERRLDGPHLDRRVETCAPVLDRELQDTICDNILETLMADNTKTRWLKADGTYVRRVPADGEPIVCAQEVGLERAQAL
jgi:Polyphosphate kinase C-terminal domain 2